VSHAVALDDRLILEPGLIRLPKTITPVRTHWFVDGQQVGITQAAERQFLWPLSRGRHTAHARIRVADRAQPITTPAVEFRVK
jgi:hypothetical protein